MAETTIEPAGKKKLNVKFCVLLPIVLVVTLFLWCVPVSFFGIDGLTVTQQRVIALFAFAALMWIFEVIPNWTTSLLVIVIRGSCCDALPRRFCPCYHGREIRP